MAETVELTVTDLKQSSYCPRIPFYRYVLPVTPQPTYKMERGKRVQEAVQALEKRRAYSRYGLREGKRLFGVTLRSERLGLTGKLDLLIRTPDACYPVDFKDADGPPRRNHRVQLAAYALLAEEAFGVPVREAFLCLVPRNDVSIITIEDRDRLAVMEMLKQVRCMITNEALPDPTPVRARCTACEFQNYCGDIW